MAENDMQQHDIEYCAFKEIRTVVMTWNAGASTPSGLRHDENDNTFFREIIQPQSAPDILVFGFQELVDLEDKKLTASESSSMVQISFDIKTSQKASSKVARRKILAIQNT